MKQLVQYIVQTFGVDNNTATTLILTLVIFLTGFILSWFGKLINQYLQKKAYRKSLRIIIKDFFKTCRRQQDLLQSLRDHKGMVYGSDYSIPIVSNYSLVYLETLEIHSFINNFISLCNKKRPKHISKLFELITIAKTANEYLRDTAKLVLERYALHEDEFNENLDSLRQQYDKIIVENIGKTLPKSQESEFIIKLAFIFQNWSESGQGTTKFETYSKIVVPLLALSRSEPVAEYKQFTIDKCLAASRAYTNLQKVNQMLRDEIANTAWHFRKIYRLGNKIEKNL